MTIMDRLPLKSWSMKEMADALGVSVSTVRRKIRSGEIRTLGIFTTRVRIPDAEARRILTETKGTFNYGQPFPREAGIPDSIHALDAGPAVGAIG